MVAVAPSRACVIHDLHSVTLATDVASDVTSTRSHATVQCRLHDNDLALVTAGLEILTGTVVSAWDSYIVAGNNTKMCIYTVRVNSLFAFSELKRAFICLIIYGLGLRIDITWDYCSGLCRRPSVATESILWYNATMLIILAMKWLR